MAGLAFVIVGAVPRLRAAAPGAGIPLPARLPPLVLAFAALVSGCREPPPPPPGPASPPEPAVLIAAAGDITCRPIPAPCRSSDTIALISRAPEVAAVLPLGDLQYETGTFADFLAGYDVGWGRLKAISHPVVGNHEYLTPDAAGYFDYWNGRGAATGPAGRRGQGYYSYRLNGWLMIALNSNCDEVGGCGPGSPQERFLRDVLAAEPATCTLAYWHHPRFSSGPSRELSEYAAFWQALYEAGADVVLSAHDHVYERFAPMTPGGERDDARGLRQFTVGTGGHSLYRFGFVHPQSLVRFSNEFGVLFLKLRTTGYEWQFEAIDGRAEPVDTGSGRCH